MFCWVYQRIHAKPMKFVQLPKSKRDSTPSKDKVKFYCPETNQSVNVYNMGVDSRGSVYEHPDGDRSIIGEPHRFPGATDTIMIRRPGDNPCPYPKKDEGSEHVIRESIDVRCYCQTCDLYTHTSEWCDLFDEGQEAATQFENAEIGRSARNCTRRKVNGCRGGFTTSVSKVVHCFSSKRQDQ